MCARVLVRMCAHASVNELHMRVAYACNNSLHMRVASQNSVNKLFCGDACVLHMRLSAHTCYFQDKARRAPLSEAATQNNVPFVKLQVKPPAPRLRAASRPRRWQPRHRRRGLARARLRTTRARAHDTGASSTVARARLQSMPRVVGT
eukprot:5899445-Pleurochrysis_carterae.AAC.7